MRNWRWCMMAMCRLFELAKVLMDWCWHWHASMQKRLSSSSINQLIITMKLLLAAVVVVVIWDLTLATTSFGTEPFLISLMPLSLSLLSGLFHHCCCHLIGFYSQLLIWLDSDSLGQLNWVGTTFFSCLCARLWDGGGRERHTQKG